MSGAKLQSPAPGRNAEFTAMLTARSHFLAAHRAWLETKPPADAVIEEADGTYSALMQMHRLTAVGHE